MKKFNTRLELLCAYLQYRFAHENIKIYSNTFQRFLFITEHLSDVLRNRSCQKFCNIHRKTPVLESLFNKVPGLKVCNFIKTKLQHRYFPVKFAKSLTTPTLKNICERLVFPVGELSACGTYEQSLLFSFQNSIQYTWI